MFSRSYRELFKGSSSRYENSHLGLDKGFISRKTFIGRRVREWSETSLCSLLIAVGYIASYSRAKHGFQRVRGKSRTPEN